jgi:DNA invertase Pin-like site-specific DNA recombinase
VLKVTIPGKAAGLYAGQSVEPLKRMRQHIAQGANRSATRNKRTAFMMEAMRAARSAGVPIEELVTIEVLPQVIAANEAAEAERELIKRTRDECLRAGYVFLNGLIGSPAGGYGRVLDAEMEVEIVNAYKSGKSSQEIAEAVGVGRSTINRIIAARGHQKIRADYNRKYNDGVISQAISLAKAGHKQDAICEQLGLSKTMLYLALKRAGLTKAYKRRSRASTEGN